MNSFLRIFKKEIIGPETDPYLIRFHLTPWKWWRFPVGFYVHMFYRPDAEPWLHDHPRKLKSLIVSGGYVEERGTLILQTDDDGAVILPSKFSLLKHQRIREAGDWVDIPISTKHRIVHLLKVPTITFLIITRKKERTWGFWIEENDEVRFVSADDYFEEQY